MNQHAIAPDSPDQEEHHPSRGIVSLMQDLDNSEGTSRLRYLDVSIKPDVKIEPESSVPLPPAIQTLSAAALPIPAVWTDPEPSKDVFLALQRWEGIVTECRGETFLARLTDLTAEGTGEEEVELLSQDVSEEDRDLVSPGAVFYWAIGYRYEASGQSSRISTLRFRRLPVWSASEIEAASERASQIAEVLAGGD